MKVENYKKCKENEESVLSNKKILIINSCVDECVMLDTFKESLNIEYDEIKLYQLNIKTKSKQEPKDGMEIIYQKISESCGIVLVCDANKKKLCDEMNLVIDRIDNFYTTELSDKLFGLITTEVSDDIIKDIKLFAIEKGLIVCNKCFVYSSNTNVNDMTDTFNKLSEICEVGLNQTNQTNQEPSQIDVEQEDKQEDDEIEDIEYPKFEAVRFDKWGV